VAASPVVALLAAHRRWMSPALLAAAVLVPLAALAACAFVDGWAARRFLAFYTAPFFLAFFLWMRIRLATVESQPLAGLAVDAAAVAVGLLRFASAAVPWSGHMLFFTYSALTTRSRGYVALVLLLAVETSWFKLGVWHDPFSWGVGIGMGLFLAARRAVIGRNAGAGA
jgi:hypothetical protein